MAVDTKFLDKSIDALIRAYDKFKEIDQTSDDYDLYQNSIVKSFELLLEQSGYLLKRRLSEYHADSNLSKMLTFKDAFRKAANYGLITEDESFRWMQYRNIRNDLSYEYGEDFAINSIDCIKEFIEDVKKLRDIIKS